MKKATLLLGLCLLAFFLTPTFSYATSGACSSHAGVDCSAGPDWDGSVICNDGWRDSSVSYSSMVMCQGTRHYCTTSEAQQLDIKYGIPEKKQNIDDLNAQLEPYTQRILHPSADTSASISSLRQDTLDVLNLTSQLNAATADLRSAMTRSQGDCYALGDEHYYQEQADFLKQLQAQQQPKPQPRLPQGPYQIYEDLRARVALNSDVSCQSLGLTRVELDMCQRFTATPENQRDLWVTIPRPDTKVVVPPAPAISAPLNEVTPAITQPATPFVAPEQRPVTPSKTKFLSSKLPTKVMTMATTTATTTAIAPSSHSIKKSSPSWFMRLLRLF